MTDPNNITPPPELVQGWRNAAPTEPGSIDREHWLIDKAAQWGADQELEACCKWLDEAGLHLDGRYLRAARRPKPPSLKEQALEAFERFTSGNNGIVDDMRDGSLIRRALEQLHD
jgi:hypothetical protein